WTIWHGLLTHARWGRGPGAVLPAQDNIEPVNSQSVRDRSNTSNQIHLYNDILRIIDDIRKRGAKLAIVSRNPSEALCSRALYYFTTAAGRLVIELVDYYEVHDESKLMFDDKAANNTVRVTLGTIHNLDFYFAPKSRSIEGVSFELVCDKGSGLTWGLYQPALIGYSGLGPAWIRYVQNGRGVVEKTESYRWGFALYVAPSSRMATFFRDSLRRAGQRRARVCEVWVKDYDAWVAVNK
ncbi:hypothetical protein DXG01_012711, partial [Tephrocybe rancida]